jgi:hypothetical protein
MLDYPELLREIAKYVRLEHYNKDSDNTGGVRSRVEMRKLPEEMVRKLLDFRKPCPACGKTMAPFRQRQGSSGSNGICWNSSCPLDANKSCSRTRVASAEYERVKAYIWETCKQLDKEGTDVFAELLDVESPQSTKSPFRPKVLLANETVYFIGAWHQSELIGIKIGKSTRPIEQRLKGLQTGSPVQLRIIGSTTSFFEKALHRRFESEGLGLHLEWFRPRLSLLDFIREACPNGDFTGFPGDVDATAICAKTVELLKQGDYQQAKSLLRTLHDF